MFNRRVIPDGLRTELSEHAALPFDHGRMLPLEVYRSNAVLDQELKHVFGPGWLCVGRAADIPEPGDWFTAELLTGLVGGDDRTSTRSIIVIRDVGGAIRALDNVCIHRGAELLNGCGDDLSRITCPYHAWVYRLDGQLLAGPYMEETVEADGSPFEPARHRLGRLPIEIWEGFIFACQSDDPEPLARRVHRNSFGVDGNNTRFTTMYPGTDQWAHHRVMNPTDPDLCAPANTSLHEDWRKTIVLAAVFPGFVIQLQPDWLWFLRITPLGTDRCRIAWQMAVAPEMLHSTDDPEAYVKGVMDLVHLVNSEDLSIVEGIRRNVNRPQFERAPLSYLERNVYDFDRYIADRLSRPRTTESNPDWTET